MIGFNLKTMMVMATKNILFELFNHFLKIRKKIDKKLLHNILCSIRLIIKFSHIKGAFF